MSESSVMKGATYCVIPHRIARMTSCTTFGGARVLRHQWCTAARRSWCLRCRENSRPAAAGVPGRGRSQPLVPSGMGFPGGDRGAAAGPGPPPWCPWRTCGD